MLLTEKLKVNFTKSFLFTERPAPLHSMLISCGFSRETSLSYRWDGEKRGAAPFVVWQLTLAGGGEINRDGAVTRFKPGELMLVHIPDKHIYYLPKTEPFWEFVYICLSGSEAARLCRDVERSAGPAPRVEPGSKTMAAAERILLAAADNSVRSPAEASLLAYGLCMAMLDDFSAGLRPGPEPNFVAGLREFCASRLGERLDVDTLARAAGYSRYHFTRLLTKHTGMSPAEFVRDMRLRHAEASIRFERLSVKEIAEKHGFSSSAVFCRAFQARNGKTPSEFRDGR